MATKRGICPYCRINNITHSIFLVNPEASSCFCGANTHRINPQQAIDTYEAYIEKMIKKADDTLNVVCNPSLAYQEYADVIEIDDTYIRPYLGRILCLVYMSKVRKSHLIDAKTLLEVGLQKNFGKVDDSPVVFSHLRKITHVVEEYLNAVKRRLTFRIYYYDVDCLTLYLTHVAEARELENAIFEAVTSIKKKYQNEKVDTFLNYLDEKIAEKERILGDYSYLTVEGKSYKFAACDAEFKASITEETKKGVVDTKTSRYRMASLNSDDKEKRFIKDEVFKDYTKTIKAKKRSIFWFIFFYVAAITFAVSIYILRDYFISFILAIVATLLLLILGTIFLILAISFSAQISQKRRKLEVY